MNSYREIIRIAAINALRTLRDSTTVTDLIPLTAPVYSSDVRMTAFSAAADIAPADQRVRGLIDAAAGDGDSGVRREAVQALIQRGDASAKEVLEQRRKVETDKQILDLITLTLDGVEVDQGGKMKQD